MDYASAGEKVVIHAPRGAMFAIERAAIQAHMTPGELARRLLIDGLRANGYELGEASSSISAEILPFPRRE
jgi:hypothetical protein